MEGWKPEVRAGGGEGMLPLRGVPSGCKRLRRSKRSLRRRDRLGEVWENRVKRQANRRGWTRYPAVAGEAEWQRRRQGTGRA